MVGGRCSGIFGGFRDGVHEGVPYLFGVKIVGQLMFDLQHAEGVLRGFIGIVAAAGLAGAPVRCVVAVGSW